MTWIFLLFSTLAFSNSSDFYAEGEDSYQADGTAFEDNYVLPLTAEEKQLMKSGNCNAISNMQTQRYTNRETFVVKEYYKKVGNQCKLIKLREPTFKKKIAVKIPHRRSNPCEEIEFNGPVSVNRTTTYNTPFRKKMNTCRRNTVPLSLFDERGVTETYRVCEKPRNSCSTQGACYAPLGNDGWSQIRWDHYKKYKTGEKKGLYVLENNEKVDTCTADFKKKFNSLSRSKKRAYDKKYTRCRHDEFYKSVDRNICPYGPGFGTRGCLNPFHNIACDTSFYPEGTVVCIPSLYGKVYRDVDGRYKRHNCLFECADTGGDFNGYGAGIFDFFSGFAEFSNKNIFVKENISSPNKGYLKHRNYCLVTGEKKEKFLEATHEVRRNNGYRGIHPLDLADRQ